MLSALRGKDTVLVYGAGGWGTRVRHLLEAHGIRVHAFLDRQAESLRAASSCPVFEPEAYAASAEADPARSAVVTAVGLRHQSGLAEWLQARGFVHVQHLSGLWNYACWSTRQELFALLPKRRAILEGAERLADRRSRDLYARLLSNHIHRACSVDEEPDGHQYFPDDVPMGRGYGCFVDCGAYTGDTVEALRRQVGKVDTIVAFEPDADSFRDLAATIRSRSGERARAILAYPCGVWSATEMKAFDNPNAPDCRVSEAGAVWSQCVRLDDALMYLAPTCIKMDVEGAEAEAIKGARRILTERRPDLAISVYHRFSDLWEILALLAGIRDDYRFYLRSYEHCNQETVLYAV